MPSIPLNTLDRARNVLVDAAKRSDANKDGSLMTAEIHAAESANGKPVTRAMLDYHRQHRVGVLNDPEIADRDKPAEMKRMNVEFFGANADFGQQQLRRIDQYRGNARRGIPPNTADGVLTSEEISNYGRTNGRLQMEARPLWNLAVALSGAGQSTQSPSGATMADLTPPGRMSAHIDKYGIGQISYEQVLARAVDAIFRDESNPETPRALVAQFGNDGEPITSKRELDAKMKELMSGGSLELLEPGESEESGDDPKTAWIFRVDVETGTDHGFWVSVDRNTGDTSVSGFN